MPVAEDSLKPWGTGEPYSAALRAERLNAPLEGVNELRRAFNRMERPEAGDAFRVADDWTGIVVKEAPATGEYSNRAAFTEAAGPGCYWIERQQPDPNRNPFTERLRLQKDNVPGTRRTVIAVNLAEFKFSTTVTPTAGSPLTRLLPRGAIVQVRSMIWHRAIEGPAVFYYFDRQPATGWWATITGSATLGGTTNQWKYAHSQVRRTATGWVAVTGGWSGTTTTDYALNSIEAGNDGTGVQGNSIDIDGADFPAGFDLKAVRGNPVVWMRLEADDTGEPAFTFQYVNGVDGLCS